MRSSRSPATSTSRSHHVHPDQPAAVLPRRRTELHLGFADGELVADQPSAERDAGVLLRQQVPRPSCRRRRSASTRPRTTSDGGGGTTPSWSTPTTAPTAVPPGRRRLPRTCRTATTSTTRTSRPRQDGVTPVMQMYLFRQPSFNSVNGGDDAIIVYHEYTHGLSNRLVGGGTARRARRRSSRARWARRGATGTPSTSWSIRATSATTRNVNGELNADAYVTPGSGHLIRTEPLDCPVGSAAPACPGTPTAGAGGYTFGDMGKIIGEREVHADGEIWGQTLWDIRNGARLGRDRGARHGRAAQLADQPGLPRRSATRSSPTRRPSSRPTSTRCGRSSRRAGWARARRRPSSDSIGVTEAFDTPAVVCRSGVTVDDSAPGGDGDGQAEPGETCQLTTIAAQPGSGAR